MNFLKVVALLNILGMLTTTSAHIGGMRPAHYDRPRTYCGRVLANALALFCYDDDLPGVKRSDIDGNMYNYLLPGSYYEEPQQKAEYGWPWIPAMKARTMGSGSRNKRQFVVSECCEKACTIKELMSYC